MHGRMQPAAQSHTFDTPPDCWQSGCIAATLTDTEAGEDNGDADLKKPKTWLTPKHVPYIMATHDCLGTMAAGMTIK